MNRMNGERNNLTFNMISLNVEWRSIILPWANIWDEYALKTSCQNLHISLVFQDTPVLFYTKIFYRISAWQHHQVDFEQNLSRVVCHTLPAVVVVPCQSTLIKLKCNLFIVSIFFYHLCFAGSHLNVGELIWLWLQQKTMMVSCYDVCADYVNPVIWLRRYFHIFHINILFFMITSQIQIRAQLFIVSNVCFIFRFCW